jgi:hypothetical protein
MMYQAPSTNAPRRWSMLCCRMNRLRSPLSVGLALQDGSDRARHKG